MTDVIIALLVLAGMATIYLYGYHTGRASAFGEALKMRRNMNRTR